MPQHTRRQFIATVTQIASIAAIAPLVSRGALDTPRRMKICLSCGSIGVSANQTEAIRLAAHYGFEAVEAYPDFLAGLDSARAKELVGTLKERGLVFGAAGLPVEFRRDDAAFQSSLKRLPALAEGLRQVGADRWGTWLSPCDNSRTYLANFKRHAQRLREVAQVLKDYGQRLGLEYVGTKTAREQCQYPFVHSMKEMKELIAEIGTGNVGFVLDSWHWWQADDSVEDLLTLTNADIVSVDLNDAPANVDKNKQQDGRRELPVATGVIDVKAFLNCLAQVGYDGPVRAEPFNKTLNDLNNEEACEATKAAMSKAFALLQ